MFDQVRSLYFVKMFKSGILVVVVVVGGGGGGGEHVGGFLFRQRKRF